MKQENKQESHMEDKYEGRTPSRSDIKQVGKESTNNKTKTSSPEDNFITRLRRNPLFKPVLTIIIIIIILATILAIQINNSRIYIEKAQVYAPIISLYADTPGVLQKVYVEEGDFVGKSKIVAVVGNKSIYPKTQGIVTSVMDTPGQYVTAQNPIVQMIEHDKLVLIGRVPENKGLKDIKVGQKVVFNLDAFGSKKYYGVVELISPSSRESDIVFSISDKREEKEFNVKVRFDPDMYPELKNGMSAKMWVYK